MKELEQRFFEKVNKTADCWLWTASKNNWGYGVIRHNQKTQKAHRISWELHNGPIQADLHVLHKCDVPACVNPDHLFLGTNNDNVQDRVNKGVENGAKGEKNCKSKLTEMDVVKIRTSYVPRKHSRAKIARDYGVCKSTIDRLLGDKTWKHI